MLEFGGVQNLVSALNGMMRQEFLSSKKPVVEKLMLPKGRMMCWVEV